MYNNIKYRVTEVKLDQYTTIIFHFVNKKTKNKNTFFLFINYY